MRKKIVAFMMWTGLKTYSRARNVENGALAVV